MKRIVICCDGTWNTPDNTEAGIPVPTNVVKFASSVKPQDKKGIVQLVYYDAGVGTSGSRFKRVYDGATGKGLLRNIREAYAYLLHNYSLGDELFFVGFSRGAFTVRSLAGLIRNSGILRPNALHMIDHAVALYRSRSAATHPREKEATLFRRTYSVADETPIKFIGVWDTVGALGNPLLSNTIFGRHNRFHDTDLSRIISDAYHALAVDEKRRLFKPTLWNQQAGYRHQTLEQTWFAGAHSSVGGGCPTTGLSDIALQWMREKAKKCGLALEATDLQENVLEQYEESRTGGYRLMSKYHRPIDRPQPGKQTEETVHDTVEQKYDAQPNYRPKNLLDYLARNPHHAPKG